MNCCSMQTNISPRYNMEFAVFLRLINIYKVTESLILTVLTCKSEKVERSLEIMFLVLKSYVKFTGKLLCQSLF